MMDFTCLGAACTPFAFMRFPGNEQNPSQTGTCHTSVGCCTVVVISGHLQSSGDAHHSLYIPVTSTLSW